MSVAARVSSLLLVLAASSPLQAEPFDHGVWNELLGRHVVVLRGGQATQVNYRELAADRAQLGRYLAALSAVSQDEFDRWARSEQLAFLINAYNAWTVELILQADREIDSIRDLGSLWRSPWAKPFVPLLGEVRSLDDIEHGLIRGSGRYAEPRIHFAVNCASIGCPALRPEAYLGARLEAQLEDATRLFLADRTRNRAGSGVVEVSGIFRWYRGDFEAGWRGARSLGQFLALYGDALGLDDAGRRRLSGGQTRITFLDYDWRLNRE
jgi:hypothetical protein